LVVIAIIAILSAILFPVFLHVKAAAKKTAALSNLKQNGMAVLLYNGDADSTFAQSAYAIGTPQGVVIPGRGAQIFSVYDAILPYTKNTDIFLDPSEPKAMEWAKLLAAAGLRPFQSGPNPTQYTGFAVNFALFEDPALPPTLFGEDPVVNDSMLTQPSGTTMFYSARYIGQQKVNEDAPGGLTPDYRQPAGPFGSTNFPGTARHAGTVVVNFADGHAKALKRHASLEATGPDTFHTGQQNAIKCYNLPYDLNGLPDVLAEPRF
jgi:prepilin-type processing-associated H-X9-DG protein